MEREYNHVYIRWCTGYLKKKTLIQTLDDLGDLLAQDGYIIILDSAFKDKKDLPQNEFL